MSYKSTEVRHEKTRVIQWKFSHCTANGNGVYAFTIETRTGAIISGATIPGLAQGVGREPKFLDVVIRTTPSGRVKMIRADVSESK